MVSHDTRLTTQPQVMSQPIVLTNGQHEIKIYPVQNRGRSVFQLSYYEGGHRQRQTCGKLADARREAKVVLGRLAVNTHEADELSTADMESYVIARKHITATGLPLHVCAELFGQAHAKLGGRSLLDAVNFFSPTTTRPTLSLRRCRS